MGSIASVSAQMGWRRRDELEDTARLHHRVCRLGYAVANLGIRADDPELAQMVAGKLSIPGNEPIDVSDERLSRLRRQLDTELRSVLRERDFADFNSDAAVAAMVELANRLRLP